MQPVLTVEFIAREGDVEFKEESVPLHSPVVNFPMLFSVASALPYDSRNKINFLMDR